MIPQHPILERNGYQSAVTDAEYDPFTFFERLPRKMTDLAANQQQFFDGSIQFDSVALHENVHWLQNTATTLGAFLAGLRYAQEGTARQWMASLSDDARRTLLAKRSSGEQPLVQLKSDASIALPGNESPDENLWRQMWYDHQLVSALLKDSKLQDSVAYPRATVIGESVSDTWLYLSERLGVSRTDDTMRLRGAYKPTDDIILVSVRRERLTTDDILEGHAFCCEMLNLVEWTVSAHGITQSLSEMDAKVRDHEYGRSARAFAAAINRSFEEWAHWAPTLAVVSDIALNPPLPPFVTTGPDSVESWPWPEIYPPIRFLRAASAIDHVGLLGDARSAEATKEYVRAVCDSAGLWCWLDAVHPCVPERTTSLIETPNSVDDLIRSGLEYVDYLLWVQDKMWSLRLEDPVYMTNLTYRKMGERSTRLLRMRLDHRGDYRWFRAPFTVSENDLFAHSSGDRFTGTASWLLLSSAVAFSMYDLVVGTGPIDISTYPTDLLNSNEFRNVITESLQSLLGEEIALTPTPAVTP